MEVVEGSAAMAAKLGAISLAGPRPPGAPSPARDYDVTEHALPLAALSSIGRDVLCVFLVPNR